MRAEFESNGSLKIHADGINESLALDAWYDKFFEHLTHELRETTRILCPEIKHPWEVKNTIPYWGGTPMLTIRLHNSKDQKVDEDETRV